MSNALQGSLPLFRLAGIDVFLHWSWFFVAALEISMRRRRYPSIAWNQQWSGGSERHASGCSCYIFQEIPGMVCKKSADSLRGHRRSNDLVLFSLGGLSESFLALVFLLFRWPRLDGRSHEKSRSR